MKMNTYSDHSPESDTPYGTRVEPHDMGTFVFGHFRLKNTIRLGCQADEICHISPIGPVLSPDQ